MNTNNITGLANPTLSTDAANKWYVDDQITSISSTPGATGATGPAGATGATGPAGTAGAIVSIQDYNNTFDSNSLTVDPNGSEKINGVAASLTVSVERAAFTLVFTDTTQGWLLKDK